MTSKLVRCDATDVGWSETPCERCSACRDRAYNRRWYAQNIDKARARTKRKRDANIETHRKKSRERYQRLRKNNPEWKERQRVYQLAHKYGLTPEQYTKMLEDQNGRCAMPSCQLLFGRSFKDRPHIDHCHRTGKVRKLLCNECNVRLGFYENNRHRHTEFAEYLVD